VSQVVVDSDSKDPATRDEEPKKKVLVVDDVPYMLDLATGFLDSRVYVVTAEGGPAGLDAVWRERPDIILCDDCMPDLDGLDLCRAVRRDEDLGQTPFIMLLSDPGARAHGAAIRAGADDVVAKPLARAPVMKAVGRFLAPSQPRGLPRVEMNLPVTVTTEDAELPGTVRNLSRGGAFIETDSPLICADEVGLRFRLPDSEVTLKPSAEVIWRRNRYEGVAATDGAGLRFVEIDARSARSLDDFVYERTTSTPFEGATR
jgi:uncharacterized protein (TIGR02266 family)